MAETVQDAVPPGRRDRRRAVPGALVLPALLAVSLLFLLPLGLLVWQSFTDPEIGIGNYVQVFTDGLTLKVLGRTFATTAVITAITLCLGYPYAYLMARGGPRLRVILLAIVMIPFWLSVMTRTFAWIVLLSRGGPISQLLDGLGFPNVTLLGSLAGATLGMVQVLLPFMVLPLYSTMSGIDSRLLDAASSLGARGWTAFRTVFLPLSLPGVTAGVTLVFVLTVGFYITPQLLGSPQNALVAQLIGIKVLQLRDFGGAGAISTVLIVFCVLLLLLATRFVKLGSIVKVR